VEAVSVVLLRGDARELPLADESVDLIVTSPPYFGLRSYTDGGEHYEGQIGSEANPRAYVAALLECTQEWLRVLKPTGSLFVNLGDKYSTYTGANWGNGRSLDGFRGTAKVPHGGPVNAPEAYGIPFKSLMGLPWRYAIRCVDDLGLTLRAEIIWEKPNGMPESVTDRVRRAHEQVFHFVRQPRCYYSAVDEIREPHTMRPQRRPGGHKERQNLGVLPAQTYSTSQRDEPGADGHPLGKLPSSVWAIASQPLTVPDYLDVDHFAAFPMELPRRCILGWSPPGICTACGEGRRPVASRVQEWTGRTNSGRAKRQTVDGIALSRGFNAAGYPHTVSHTSITGYACACTPYTDHPERRGKDFHAGTDRATQGMNDRDGSERYQRYVEELENPRGPVREYHFDEWTPAPPRPSVVLDPFGGTGTSALLADALGRIGISVDRSADYCRLARWRTTDPAERAKALQVPKPPPVPDGQDSLFEVTA
jgi:DNA modification methylase